MALETQYVVGTNPENNYPVIYRCIIVDGVEVSRGEPTFQEVKAAYPAIIEEYFNAVAAWAHTLADYFDTQVDFTVDNYLTAHRSSRFFLDFDMKFDYASIATSSELPHLQTPEPVVEAPVVEEPAPAPVEETPVTE